MLTTNNEALRLLINIDHQLNAYPPLPQHFLNSCRKLVQQGTKTHSAFIIHNKLLRLAWATPTMLVIPTTSGLIHRLDHSLMGLAIP